MRTLSERALPTSLFPSKHAGVAGMRISLMLAMCCALSPALEMTTAPLDAKEDIEPVKVVDNRPTRSAQPWFGSNASSLKNGSAMRGHRPLGIAVVLTGLLCLFGFAQALRADPPAQAVAVQPSAEAASAQTVADADGNIYHTVQIGNQVWTVENLRTTRFNDGTPIAQVTDPQEWSSLSTAALCSFNNDPEHGKKYGLLYNWYAASAEKIAPKGWRVPTHDEQLAMRQHLIASGYNYDGTTEGNKVAKSMATTSEWPYRDRDAYGKPAPDAVGMVGNNSQTNNRSGFSAIPAGSRWYDGSFHAGDTSAYWWSVTPQSDTDGYHTSVHTWFAQYGDNHHDKRTGFSIRLIRDSGDR